MKTIGAIMLFGSIVLTAYYYFTNDIDNATFFMVVSVMNYLAISID